MTTQTTPNPRKPHHPLAARIKRLMQADDGVGKIAQGTPLAISKAVELLLLEISYGGIRVAQREGVRTVGVRHLGQVPVSAPEFAFLSCLNAHFVQGDVGGEKLKNEGKKRKGGAQVDGNYRLNNAKPAVNVRNKRKKYKKEKNISNNQQQKNNKKIDEVLDEPIVLDNGEEEDDDVIFVNAIYNNKKQQKRHNNSNGQKIPQNGNTQFNNLSQISIQQQHQQQLHQQQQQNQSQIQQQIEQIQLQQQFSYKQYNNSNIIKQSQQQQQHYQAPSFQQLQTISGISSLGQSGGLYDDEDDYDNL